MRESCRVWEALKCKSSLQLCQLLWAGVLPTNWQSRHCNVVMHQTARRATVLVCRPLSTMLHYRTLPVDCILRSDVLDVSNSQAPFLFHYCQQVFGRYVVGTPMGFLVWMWRLKKSNQQLPAVLTCCYEPTYWYFESVDVSTISSSYAPPHMPL